MFYWSFTSLVHIFGLPQLLILAMAMPKNLTNLSLIVSNHSIKFYKDLINSIE